MTKVAILQREIPHYRVRFFEEASAQASSMGLELTVYCADTGFSEGVVNFAHRGLPIWRLKESKSAPFWMKGLTAALTGTDIVVAPQELQCLNVPYLWAKRHRLCKRWIWWGHGYNFQASVGSSGSTYIKEAVKRFMTRRANGLITYTEGGAAYWRARGMPTERVIPYFNTIDVRALRNMAAQISKHKLREKESGLGLDGKDVLLFSGRLYPEKQVAFLLRAFGILQSFRPNVSLLILGDGAERARLEALRNELQLQHVHFLGESVDPVESSCYFLLADLLVIPGDVGVAIVHGFAFDLPLLTTRGARHGPEIEYLSSENGIMTSARELDYARAIGSVLASPSRLRTMHEAAHVSGDQLLLETSVRRFLEGIRTLAGIRS